MPSRHYDEIAVGAELPPFTAPPLNRLTLALYAGASITHVGDAITCRGTVVGKDDATRTLRIQVITATGREKSNYPARPSSRWTANPGEYACRPLACEIVRSGDPCQPDIEHSPRSDTTEGTSQMTTSARVALWFAATLILALCVLTALLIFPSRPADSHSLRFDGYIVLPKVKNSGALALLDYLTVFGDDLFVASVSTGAVYKINLHARAMPDSADVSVFESEPAAHGVVVDPTSHLAYVTRSDANTVDVFDPTNMRLVKRIPVAADPDGIFYEPSNQLVYVASSDAMLATLIDPASQDSIATISLGGKPEFAAFDPKTKLLYQNLADTNTVVAVDLTKRSVVLRSPLEGCEMPTGMAIDDADRRLFIACGKSGKLAIFDLDLRRIITSVPVGFGADSVAYDPGLHRIYVTGLLGRLSVVNQDTADTYHVVDSIYLHFNAHTLAIDPVTHRLFVGYASLAIPSRLAVFTPNF